MSGKFSLDDYVDVAERIREFNAKFPDGSLQGEGEFIYQDNAALLPGGKEPIPTRTVVGYIYHARAYRSPDDPRPGMGTAYEPIPGKTPYTRDSEVQNAETAAWGRAIVALGFETKKIASKQEVQNRQNGKQETTPATEAQLEEIDDILGKLAKTKGNKKADWIKAIDDESGDSWRVDYDSAALVLAKVRRWKSVAEAQAAT